MEYFITEKKSSVDTRFEFINFMEKNFPDIRFVIELNYKMLRNTQYYLCINNPFDLKNYPQIEGRLDPENSAADPVNILINIFLDNLYPDQNIFWYNSNSVIVNKNLLMYDTDFNIPENIQYYINNNLKNPLYILDRDGYLSSELALTEELDSILVQTLPSSSNFTSNIIGNYAFTGYKLSSHNPLLCDYFSTYTIPDAPSIFVDLVKRGEKVVKRIYLAAPHEILRDKELWVKVIFPILNCSTEEFDEFIRSFKTEESLERDAMKLVYTINRRTKEKLEDLQSKQTIVAQRINDLIYEVGTLQSNLRTFKDEYVSTLHGSRNRKYIVKKILGEFQNILNLPEVTDMRVSFEEEPSICIDIEALPCESGEKINVEPPVLGPYVLEIEPHTLSIKILNSGNPREGYAHPHCSNGDVPCFGDFTDIHGMIINGEYTSAVAQIIHGFLRCYNIHDQWGKHIFFWSPHYGFESLISSDSLVNWDLSEYADEYREIYGSDLYEDYTCEYCHEPLDYCICTYCESCGDRIDECECDRCPNCNELINNCECDRCPKCEELTEDCCCERCDVCYALIEDCICERCSYCGEFVEYCECEFQEESEEDTQEERQEESREEFQSETTRACNTCGAILQSCECTTRCNNCIMADLQGEPQQGTSETNIQSTYYTQTPVEDPLETLVEETEGLTYFDNRCPICNRILFVPETLVCNNCARNILTSVGIDTDTPLISQLNVNFTPENLCFMCNHLSENCTCVGIPVTSAVIEACHRQLNTFPQTVETSL